MEHPTVPLQNMLDAFSETPASSEQQNRQDTVRPHHFDNLETNQHSNGATKSLLSPAVPTVGHFSTNKMGQHPKQKFPSGFSRWISEWITDWWGLELACWSIAVLSLIAIVIILESHKNKPLPEYGLGITLNSLIAIFATISQMAMMKPIAECISQLKWLWFIRKQKLGRFQTFDDASRGLIGSLFLLGKLRGIHLASLGAVITIAAAAFGPFTQQVVTYSMRLHPTRSAAFVPQVFNYSASPDGDASPAVVASVYEGMVVEGTLNLSSVSVSCSTGNCTWATYSSLGVCASVSDLSSAIISNTCNITMLAEILESEGITDTGYPCFNYTLPGMDTNPTLSPGNILAWNPSLSNVSPDNLGTGAMDVVSINSIFTNSSSLSTVYVIYQPGFATSINSSLPSPIAYGLNLNLCIQTYNTTVSDTTVNTTMLSTQNLPTYIEKTFIQVGASESYTGNDSYISIEGKTFGLSIHSLAVLSFQLETMFNTVCYDFIPIELNENSTNQTSSSTCSSSQGIAIFDAIQDSTDSLALLTNIWDNVAISITNAFRTTTTDGNIGGGGDTQIGQFQGTAFTPVSYVDSNYLCLILPIALISLTLVFLLATMLQSQRLGSRIWKSSNLATLQGLHGELHQRLGGLSSTSEMEEKTKGIKVRFDMKSGTAENGVEYRLIESRQEADWRG